MNHIIIFYKPNDKRDKTNTMKTKSNQLRLLLIKLLLKFKYLIPSNIQVIIDDWFFLYSPIWLIKKLSVEFDGYLKYNSLEKDDVVFDCGGWKGHFTLVASRLVGKNGKVYTFEPQEDMYNFITRRVKKYNLKNIEIINSGLYSNRSTFIIEKEISNGGFSLVDLNNVSLNNPVKINVIDIDSFVKEHKIKNLDYIKMDIEGAEIEALEGARNTLKNNSVKLAIASYHVRNGVQTAKWVEDFLVEQGYKSWTNNPPHLTTYGYKL